MTILPQEIIRKKRDGLVLDEAEIAFFVQGLSDGTISEGQVAAFGMSVFFQGMTPTECAELTRAMTRSGDVMSWDLPGPVLDKHSTGGVGDLVSLVLGPMIAACGGFVPMISGRGLGHTGGTLDKLEAIPGYNALPDTDRFRKTVQEAGVAIIGQTGNLAPADGRFYAVRDVTATVESIPLITASILSKKLAAGLDVLVMDVKSGNGAFMPSHEQSVALAKSIVSVANRAGMATSALVTGMNEPLAPCAGNSVEVAEAVQYLTGLNKDERLDQVVMALCAEMLVTGGLVSDEKAACELLLKCLESGAAADRFGCMVSALGGPVDFIERWESYLPIAKKQVPVTSRESGYIQSWDTRKLGLAVVSQGGGRTRADQSIDHSVGLTGIRRIGEYIEAGEPLAFMQGCDRATSDTIGDMVRSAVSLSPQKVDVAPLVYDKIQFDSGSKE